MGSVWLIFDPEVLIGVRVAKFKAVDVLKKHPVSVHGPTREAAFVRLMENFAGKVADVLKYVEHELDKLCRSALNSIELFYE